MLVTFDGGDAGSWLPPPHQKKISQIVLTLPKNKGCVL